MSTFRAKVLSSAADPDEVDEVFRAVAARSLAEDDFAEWLRGHVEKAGV
ncbi:MAG TPA: hypothetical protein VG147_10275 [Solirubrobacteraceae bacterium]|jgi:hypothetical protein|nr:hypothetical protein [Solirubrobacteraceae bacterium]